MAEIRLNRPEAMNSISTELAGALARACAEVAAAPEVLGGGRERGLATARSAPGPT